MLPFYIITLRRAKSNTAARNVRYLWTSSSNGAEPPNGQVSDLKSGCLHVEKSEEQDVVLEGGERYLVVPLSGRPTHFCVTLRFHPVSSSNLNINDCNL